MFRGWQVTEVVGCLSSGLDGAPHEIGDQLEAYADNAKEALGQLERLAPTLSEL